MTRPKAISEARGKSFPSFVSVLWAASQSRLAGLADAFGAWVQLYSACEGSGHRSKQQR